MVLADPVALTRLATKAGRAALRTGKVPPRLAWRRWVLSRGRDDTAAAGGRSTLVIAPHPDDETIGCGAAIARKRTAGTPVEVAVVTDGRHSHLSPLVSPTRLAELREAESRAACDLLGVAPDSVRFLGYEEGTLWRCLDDLVATLAALIETVRPDEILVTSEHDWHDDHRAVNAAVRRAAAQVGYSGLLGAFPVWFWADGPWTTHPTAGLGEQLRTLGPTGDALRLPRPWLVATEGFVDRKRAAFARYLSQTTNLTGEPTWAVFPDGWLDPFCGPHEPFFPLAPDARAAAERQAAAGLRLAAAPTIAGPTIAAAADDFDDERGLGAVIGTRSSSGALRSGVDAEGTVGIDGGELRLAALDRPGWGRQGIAYGPFSAAPGLTLAVQILNGHNTAQSNTLPQGRKALVKRLAAEFPHVELDPAHLDDNLAIGFYPSPDQPGPTGHGLVMHAGGILNGELRARVGGGLAELVQAVQEVPLRYVVALRDGGAVYYLASVPGAHGAAALPLMRPVCVDATPPAGLVWAGIHQAVHGEVGHDIATRVAAVRAEFVAELAGWGAGTLVADRLADRSPAAPWRPGSGTVVRSERGATSAGSEPAWAWLAVDSAAGLVHVVIDTAPVQGADTAAGLLFRCGEDGSGWRVVVNRDRATLAVRTGQDAWEPVAERAVRLDSGQRTSLQVLDDGTTLAVNLGGTSLFGWISDTRHATNRGAGVLAGPLGSSATVADFEVFPRTLPVPAALDLGEPWFGRGSELVFEDRFDGPAGPLQEAGWERTLGAGSFQLADGGGCVVVASPSQPNPGRTLYTRPWPHPDLADLEVVLTPPGTGQGQGHGSRGGVTFFQDPDNLLVLNAWLDDTKDHDGSSLSLFFRLDGRERVYDAVWTNVGRRIRWGHTSVIRASFDGSHLVAWLDGEPVLWRRISDIRPNIAPLRITRVGLAANREWGDDTGTHFHRITARRR